MRHGMLVVVFSSLMMIGIAVAGPFTEFLAAWDRGDYPAAFRLVLPLAQNGSRDAQALVGAGYSEGKGVGQDHAKAAKWWLKAAEQGHANAQVSLGAAYQQSKGVPQDYVEAAKWYRKAADQGNAKGQLNLGEMYRVGAGVPQNYVEAHKWFELAAIYNSTARPEDRNSAAASRNLVAAEMTSQQIAEAQKLAREWTAK